MSAPAATSEIRKGGRSRRAGDVVQLTRTSTCCCSMRATVATSLSTSRAHVSTSPPCPPPPLPSQAGTCPVAAIDACIAARVSSTSVRITAAVWLIDSAYACSAGSSSAHARRERRVRRASSAATAASSRCVSSSVSRSASRRARPPGDSGRAAGDTGAAVAIEALRSMLAPATRGHTSSRRSIFEVPTPELRPVAKDRAQGLDTRATARWPKQHSRRCSPPPNGWPKAGCRCAPNRQAPSRVSEGYSAVVRRSAWQLPQVRGNPDGGRGASRLARLVATAFQRGALTGHTAAC
jgi:hypothetical protein